MNDEDAVVSAGVGRRRTVVHTRDRLDRILPAQGLTDSRARAQALIRQGLVTVNDHLASRPSQSVHPGDVILLDPGDDYASRGALKLEGALTTFAAQGMPGPHDRLCLDIGASTGGFTDVLLRHGARRVIALDVGHGQLLDRIAADPRVIDMSGVNIREVQSGDLPFRPEYVVSDVSFISLTYVIPVLPALLAPAANCLLLVKPQFEVGRSLLGHHGIVTDEDRRREALERVLACAREQRFVVRATMPSPITGAHGNVEYLLWLSWSRSA